MVTKEQISKAWQQKGESALFHHRIFVTNAVSRFGWVNASYVYGLTLVNSHMKRALGALVNWDKFQDMMNAASKHKAEEIIDQSREHTSEAVFRAAENETHRVLPPAHGEEKTDVPVHAAEVETEHKSAEEGAH